MVHAVAIDPIEEMHAPDFDRNAMSQAARLLRPCVAGVSPLQQLLRVSASWAEVSIAHDRPPASGPRLRSPRHRGVAPTLSMPDGVTDMHQGTLLAFPNGLVLEPADLHRPCLHIPCSMVQTATFYRDAFDLTLSSQDRLIVKTDSVDHLDSIFQAYL